MFLPFLSRFGKKIVRLQAQGLYLRSPRKSDMLQWIELRRCSSDFLRPWEPKWPDGDLTPAGYYHRLRIYDRQASSGSGKTFFLFDKTAETLLGGISLTRIQQGRLPSATLGYWMGKPHAGKGYMSIALPALLQHAFEDMKLDHVDAACLPHNLRSCGLLRKCGFDEMCRVSDYLEIDSKLEDHILLRCDSKRWRLNRLGVQKTLA